MLWKIILVENAIVGFFTQCVSSGMLAFVFWLAWRDHKQQRKKRAEEAEYQRLLNMIDAAWEDRDIEQRSDAFTRWYRVARQENPDLSLKESVVLFLAREGSNSGLPGEDSK